MRAIQDEISGIINRIKSDLATLKNLPEFGFEALEVCTGSAHRVGEQ